MSIIKTLLSTSSLRNFAVFSAVDFSGEVSLADLAGMQTDEIKTLDSRLFPAGLFAVRCTSVSLGKRDPKEGINEKTGLPFPALFYVEFRYEVMEASPLDKKVDADSLVGRTLVDSITLWPETFDVEIGVMKGNYKRIGLPNEGVLGGLEGGEPGWLDGAVDHIFPLKVSHGKADANGIQRARMHWQKMPEAEAA